jgi:hypothetical protein
LGIDLALQIDEAAEVSLEAVVHLKTLGELACLGHVSRVGSTFRSDHGAHFGEVALEAFGGADETGLCLTDLLLNLSELTGSVGNVL